MIAQAPVLLLFLPIVIALVMYLVRSSHIHWLILPLQITLMTVFILYVLAWQADPSIGLLVFGGWDPRIAISFYLDELNLTFIGLSLLIFSVILYYSFKANYHEKKFFFFIIFLEAVFLGLLMSNDLFNIFVFLELTALLVTLLITYRKGENALKAGLQYLLLTSVAAILYLLAVLFLYYVFGHINVQLIGEAMPEFLDTSVVKFAYVLMMTGFSLKAALFPLYNWLPKAHGVAPSSVSALLSGLIVKAALYLIMRMHGQMFHTPYDFSTILFWLGFISALAGVILAMVQKDLKQILAYHTVSQVGLMLIGLSFNTGHSFVGGWFHIVNHAIFKGLLFLAAGVIIKAYQTKKVYAIRGVFKTLPWTAVLLLIGMLAITGAPLLNGFVSKTMIKYAFKDDLIMTGLFNLINLGTIISFSKVAMMLFGKPLQPVVLVKRASVTQHIPMTVLALLAIGLGIAYQPLFQTMYQWQSYNVHLEDIGVYLDYLVWLSIGFNIYYFVIRKDGLVFQKLRDFNFTFPTANALLVAMLVTFLTFVLFF